MTSLHMSGEGGGSGEPCGCHVDLGPGEAPDGCVFDYGEPRDCGYAQILASKGQGRDACTYWRPITFVNAAATPDLLTAARLAESYLAKRVTGTGGEGETVVLPALRAALSKAGSQ